MSAFEELGICPDIIQSIEEDDWLLPTAVQQDAIPLILTGGDVLVAAETGSGKTGAFGLPCLQIVQETLRGKCSTKKAGASDQKCELSLSDKDHNVDITENSLECKSTNDKRWSGIRATMEALKGKYMYEVEVVEGSAVRVGWSASCGRLDLGTEDKSFGFGSTGKKSLNKNFEDYGEAFEEGDIIGCMLDRDEGTISFAKNGVDLGVAFKLPEELEKVGLKPHVCGKAFHVACNFEGEMEYPIQGYTSIGDADPTHTSSGMSYSAGKRPPMCMILEPTRDLAEQTYNCMVKFNKHLDNPKVRISLFVGGADETQQLKELDQGVDIAVGTLQKIMDYVRRGKLDVTQIKFLVLDEADDLQKKDDRKEIPGLNTQIKQGRRDRVQTLLFSATLHTPEIHQMIEEITTQPIWVDLKGKDAVPDTVHHVCFEIDPNEELKWEGSSLTEHAKNMDAKPKLDGVHQNPTMSEVDKAHPHALKLSEKIKQMKPRMCVKIADVFSMKQCLIFCRTNIDCDNLENYFNSLGGGGKQFGGKMEGGLENPYSCVVLAGAREQNQRRKNLEAFKDGDVRFLIATDVAARGIDIKELPFVIQTCLPDDIENYIHRIGRCGRAERLGLCVSLVATEREKVWYHKCPSRGKNCTPRPGNTKLTIPFGADQKMKAPNQEKLLVDEGGCCAYYDEPELIKLIEKRIDMPMAIMDKGDFGVPGVMESPLGEDLEKKAAREASQAAEGPLSRRALKRKKEDGGSGQMIYGKKKKTAADLVKTSKHTFGMAPAIAELHMLEREIQEMFTAAFWGSDAGVEDVSGKAWQAAATAASTEESPQGVAAVKSGWGAQGDKPKKKAKW